MAATAGYSPRWTLAASCWRCSPGQRINVSRNVEPPVRAVRCAMSDRSARKMMPTKSRDMVGNVDVNIIGWNTDSVITSKGDESTG